MSSLPKKPLIYGKVMSIKTNRKMEFLLEELVRRGYFLTKSEALRTAFFHYIECVRVLSDTDPFLEQNEQKEEEQPDV